MSHLLVLLLTLGAACAPLHVATGPKWVSTEQRLPLPEKVADHRDKDALLFAVFGDAGTGRADQIRVGRHMADECAARGGCDFMLVLGDNIYYTGVRKPKSQDGRTVFDRKFHTRFELPYEPLGRLDFWLVAGNHDWYGPGSVEAEVQYTAHSPRWRMPALDYEVPRLPEWIRIYGVDTVSLRRGRGSAQLERAEAALCEDAGWRLLFGHHPIYSSGAHSDFLGTLPDMQRALGPLIERCDVHLYFAGHDHHQEHLTAPAFEQIVQGAAAKLRKVRPIRRREAGVRQLAAASAFGFALVRATPSRLRIRFFGYTKKTEYAELHCRDLRLGEFATPRRSLPCDPQAAAAGP